MQDTGAETSLESPQGTQQEDLTVLGIETSCDETAAAIVRGRPGARPAILSNMVFSQLEAHAPYGGVVPEIAARAHLDHIDGLVVQALEDAGVGFDDLDGIAATAGPGLIGGLLVGLSLAKGLAAMRSLPLIAVNHLEGHALSARLTEPVTFPYLLLLISGGHCQLLSVRGPGSYVRLGTTIDDAVGEAFDKTAKLLGLGYPGGPAIERVAADGDATRFPLPRPLVGRAGADFSFSGLKTAVRQTALSLGTPNDQDIADIAAAFQAAVTRSLCDRTGRAMGLFEDLEGCEGGTLVVAGGVAANRAIRAGLETLCGEHGFTLSVPPAHLCTDNGAMIAWAGLERLYRGSTDSLDVTARPRWPLDPEARAMEPRTGAKGARA